MEEAPMLMSTSVLCRSSVISKAAIATDDRCCGCEIDTTCGQPRLAAETRATRVVCDEYTFLK